MASDSQSVMTIAANQQQANQIFVFGVYFEIPVTSLTSDTNIATLHK